MRFIAVSAALALGLVLTTCAAVARPLDKGPAGSIYSVRDNGTDRRLVVQPQIPARWFVRSPGGRSIAYVQEVDGVQALFTADVSGSNPVRLTPPNMTGIWAYAFAPNGRFIAFAAREACGDFCQPRLGLFVVDRDGGFLRFLADGSYDPSWSPDSHRIASDSPRGIVVTNIGSGASTVIATGYYVHSPIWSPRGDRIAYGTSREGYGAACTVAPDGSRKSCTHGRSFKWLVWSPDRRRLAFKQVRPARLGIMDAYARHLRRFAQIDRTTRPVAWSPDGTRLAYVSGAYWDAVRVMRVGAPQRAAVRVVYEPRTTLTDIRWRGHRISYIAG
jgi:Tol biopolymer transport system component